MKEYMFEELGYFTSNTINGIKKAMDGKTYMNFEVSAGGSGANLTLIVKTDYDASADDVKQLFLRCVLNGLALYKNKEV